MKMISIGLAVMLALMVATALTALAAPKLDTPAQRAKTQVQGKVNTLAGPQRAKAIHHEKMRVMYARCAQACQQQKGSTLTREGIAKRVHHQKMHAYGQAGACPQCRQQQQGAAKAAVGEKMHRTQCPTGEKPNCSCAPANK